MKRRITYILLGFSGLLTISCREMEVNDTPNCKAIVEINALRKNSDSIDYSATDTGDPPKTGTNWRINK